MDAPSESLKDAINHLDPDTRDALFLYVLTAYRCDPRHPRSDEVNLKGRPDLVCKLVDAGIFTEGPNKTACPTLEITQRIFRLRNEVTHGVTVPPPPVTINYSCWSPTDF